MGKLCSCNEVSNLEELIGCYRHFNNYCESGKIDEFLAIGYLAELQYATNEILADYEYSEEILDEIKSILDLVGYKFSHCESVTGLVSDSLNDLEEF